MLISKIIYEKYRAVVINNSRIESVVVSPFCFKQIGKEMVDMSKTQLGEQVEINSARTTFLDGMRLEVSNFVGDDEILFKTSSGFTKLKIAQEKEIVPKRIGRYIRL